MLKDEDIQHLYKRVDKILQKDGEPIDYYHTCVIVADLLALSFDTVYDVCIEL